MERVNTADRESVEMVPGVHVTALAAGDRLRGQYARIEPGAGVDLHSHSSEQLSYILQGTLTVLLENGETATVGEGESVVMAAGEPHGAENRGADPVEVVESFSPPRDTESE